MKLIAGAAITAVLLSGCGGVSIGNSDADVEIALAKLEACKQVNDFKLNNTTLKITVPIALAFSKLAEIDDKYADLADAAYFGAVIDGRTISSSSELLTTEYLKSTAKLLRFCALD